MRIVSKTLYLSGLTNALINLSKSVRTCPVVKTATGIKSIIEIASFIYDASFLFSLVFRTFSAAFL